ncbi:DedA family protein [Microbacterium sp. gxy059]|uniref:DedA family protein n=1 Tax=Microbacterium sp. gxy059 TaxID=2957199 RepID=UPI003D9610AD
MDLLIDAVLSLAGSPVIFLVVFAFALLDGFFPPVPSETVLVGATAIGLSTGHPEWALLGVVAAAGAFTGDNLTYAIGRGVGTRRFRWMRSERGRRAISLAERGLARGGASAILIARYIPIGRTAVNLTAGATRYPRARFVLLSLIAAVSWSAYSVGIGALAGAWLGDHPLIGAGVGIVAAIVLGLVADRIIAAVRTRRGRRATQPSSSATPKSTGAHPRVVMNTTSREMT